MDFKPIKQRRIYHEIRRRTGERWLNFTAIDEFYRKMNKVGILLPKNGSFAAGIYRTNEELT